MPVRVTDDGQVVKLADEMQAAEKFAAEGDDANLGELDAPLLQVAAECFLTTGAAL